MSASPVKATGTELGLPVTDDPRDLLEVEAELGVVVAYGRILSSELLAHLPMVNLHFSLLPRWRGAAPVERAILAGDTRTGVCLMEVTEGLDEGGVHACTEVPITAGSTAGDLRAELAELGARLLVDNLAAGLPPARPQPVEGVTYAAKITPAELELDWTRTASELDRVVRVGGAWTTWRNRRLKVHRAVPVDPPAVGIDATADTPGSVAVEPAEGAVAIDVVCGRGRLRLEVVQPEGRAVMPAADWARGARPHGTRFGTPGGDTGAG